MTDMTAPQSTSAAPDPPKTIVLQSRAPEVASWVETCLGTVGEWAAARGFAYRLTGDELFDSVPKPLRQKAAGRGPVLADLGRLRAARESLAEYERVIWLDSDVLVFDPGFDIGADTGGAGCAFGREIWVQEDRRGRLEVRPNVHNAVCLFERGTPVLDFLIFASEHIVGQIEGGFPDQIAGPKLLTALHNMIGFPLIHSCGMTSPLVLRDLACGDGPALELLIGESEAPLSAVNLCSSFVGKTWDGVTVDDGLIDAAASALLGQEAYVTNR